MLWSANRSDSEPLAIPADRLPCDRLTPPLPEFAETATSSVERVLELFGAARIATDEQLASLRSPALARPSLWGSLQVDVTERLHQIGVHIVEVVVQAEKMLGATEPEARRIVRRIAATRGLHESANRQIALDALDAELTTLSDKFLHSSVHQQ